MVSALIAFCGFQSEHFVKQESEKQMNQATLLLSGLLTAVHLQKFTGWFFLFVVLMI